MQFGNTEAAYGWVNILVHWLLAICIISLFAVGLWMEDLDYSSQWYQLAPHWHKSVGVLVVGLMIARLVWRFSQPKPQPFSHYKAWEIKVSHWVHYSFYLLVVLMFPTGYFITTSKGNSLEVFNWFSIPAVIENANNLADTAGEIHELIGFTIIGLVVVHALGALKHHFFDKDRTLLRMLGRP